MTAAPSPITRPCPVPGSRPKLQTGCLVTAADPAASHAVLRLVKDGAALEPVGAPQ